MDESSMEHGIDWTGQDPAGWYLSEKFNGCRAAVRYCRFTPSMRFMVFDAPTMPGSWPERLQRAAVSLSGGIVARCVEYRVCYGLSDAVQEFYRVKGLRGEGLMLRAPDHRYAARRTEKLLKFKDSALIALCSMVA